MNKEKYKRKLVYCLVNRVVMHDVARVVKILGGSPIMSEEKEELVDIISDCKSVLLNMGTPTKERFEVAEAACRLAEEGGIPVILDPVGCNQTDFRLKENMKLLESKAIVCLKVNLAEAISLLNGVVDGGGSGTESLITGTSEENLLQDTVVVAKGLSQKYGKSKSIFCVVITGKTDVVSLNNEIYELHGERNFASRLVGTGCLLGGILAEKIGSADSIKAISSCTGDVPIGFFGEGNEGMKEAVLGSVLLMKTVTEKITDTLKGCYVDGVFHEELLNQFCLQRSKVYAITDEKLDFENELIPRLRWMLEEGIDYVQYRNKVGLSHVLLEEGQRIKSLCHQYGTPLIINDRVDIAKRIGADGVHLGAQDADLQQARRMLGAFAIIGATVKTEEQAKRAIVNKADYVGIGAIYPSTTKQNAIQVSKEQLLQLCESIEVDKFGIGGITVDRITPWMMESLNGVALVNGLFGQINEATIKMTIRSIKLKMLYEKGNSTNRIIKHEIN